MGMAVISNGADQKLKPSHVTAANFRGKLATPWDDN